MKKTQIKRFISNGFTLILLALIGFPIQTQAQTTYKQTAESYIVVAGTSTLHNWTMTSKEMQFQTTFENGADGLPLRVKALSLSVNSESLKSEHKAMDKNAYSALKTDKHKAISFTLTSATVQKDIIQCSGNLTIAGVTKPITIDATCKLNPSGSLRCTGSKPIKMSEFQVEPPTFMFGTVKTGDDITISFNMELVVAKN